MSYVFSDRISVIHYLHTAKTIPKPRRRNSLTDSLMKRSILTLTLHFATQIANYSTFCIEMPRRLTNSHQALPG